jgi:glycosyltransferase
MRVLLTALGARPHLYPVVPLGWAFRAAGHDVRLASTPALAADLRLTGLPAVTVGSGPVHTETSRAELSTLVYSQPGWPADWAADLSTLDPAQHSYLELLGGYMVASAEAMVDGLVSFARAWRPELIVYDAVSFAGPVAAAVLGVPSARHVFGTAAVPRLELRAPGDQPLDGYVRLFARFGLEPRIDPTVHIDPTPPRMRLAQQSPRLDARYVPYNGPGLVPEPIFSAPGRRPRVCVTWGHTSARALGASAADPYREAIEEIVALGAEVLVVTTAEQIALLGDVPERVRTLPSAPLQLVLPYCDVLVQQGGDGTTLTAAALGVPQLAISRKPDAELPAGRLARAGAGIHLRYQELRDDPGRRTRLRDAIERLLTEPAFRDAARSLREEIAAQPAPARLVPRLTALAGG